MTAESGLNGDPNPLQHDPIQLGSLRYLWALPGKEWSPDEVRDAVNAAIGAEGRLAVRAVNNLLEEGVIEFYEIESTYDPKRVYRVRLDEPWVNLLNSLTIMLKLMQASPDRQVSSGSAHLFHER